MRAGIDCGSTLVKAYWQSDGEERFASSADHDLPVIRERLRTDGVKRIHEAGTGRVDEGWGFEIRRLPGDRISAEKRLQAEGARRLLSTSEGSPERFLLVSIGTGTSYTLVDGPDVRPFPIGNPIGGGFLSGLCSVIGWTELDNNDFDLAASTTHLDILLKERLPELAADPRGEFVLAHFAKATYRGNRYPVLHSIVHCLVVAIIRDVLLISPLLGDPTQIVFIGTLVNRIALIRTMLTRYAAAIGKQAIFPAKGEYALAVGAYHSTEF